MIPDRAHHAHRYIAWLGRHARVILLAHGLVFALAIYLIAFHLPLYADFSYLLPQDAPAVRDLRKIERRVKTTDTVLVVIRALTPALRESATRDMMSRLGEIPRSLVEQVDGDDAEARAYLKANRHLLVSLPDLERAREALEKRIAAAKREANPAYIELDDDEKQAATKDKQDLEKLRAERKRAEARLERPTNVSADGLAELLMIRTAFGTTDVERGEALLAGLHAARDEVIARHPGVEIGFAGGVVTALSEHRALVNGTLMSSIVTTLLVALVLAFYFRSARLLILLVGTLVVATAAAFGAAAFTVGHLNAATAFLGAIIAGNGINYGILLIARYLEERRAHSVEDSLATAIRATLRPTAVASLGASIAYGSLAATSFRGFADFAVIGAIGMLLCWIATYGLLPVLMLKFARSTRIFDGTPVVGSTLARLFGFRRPSMVLAGTGVVALVASVIVVRYLIADPFEYDIRKLRSEGADAATERHWMAASDRAFGRGYAGRTYIAADRLDQVPQIVAALHDPAHRDAIGSVESILDVVPEEQPEKLAVLADIRKLLDDKWLEALDDSERAELDELRPPDELAAITPSALPASIRERLTEKDGRIGYLISIRPADGIDEQNGRDLITFAQAVRRIKLPDGETVTTSGASVIFADIISTIAADGPLVTAIAAVGLAAMVLLVVGRNRRSIAVIAATATGSLLMVACCALLGLKVNFLDFVALPITLGLGIDYAINVGHRQDAISDPIATLRTSGAAVFVCSLTTMIGYGSLLVSDNLAIKGFGTASLIGEVTSVLTALVLVPALLAVGRTQD